jgi:hypothetical protein
MTIDEAISAIPQGWFLAGACENRSPIIFRGDKHEPHGTWHVALQWIDGGCRLVTHNAETLAMALECASEKARNWHP